MSEVHSPKKRTKLSDEKKSKKDKKKSKKSKKTSSSPPANLTDALGVTPDVTPDAAVASLFAPDKAVVRERVDEVQPLTRGPQLTQHLDALEVPSRLAGEGEAAEEAEEAAAVRRRQSRKKRRDEHPPADPQVEADKLRRTVFVGGLPVMNKHAKLAKYFSKYGKVESVRIRSVAFASQVNDSMRRAHYITGKFNDKRDTCNGYVVFEDASSVESAVAQENGREDFKPGFVLRVDRAEQPTLKPKKSVFVGNMPFEATEKQMREAFERFGPIEYVRLVRDGNTGLGRGFGYVCFEKRDQAAAAAKPVDPPVTVGERKVRIERCVDKGKSLGRAKYQPPMKKAKGAQQQERSFTQQANGRTKYGSMKKKAYKK